MGGLILVVVLGIWFLIVLALTSWIAKKLPQRWWKTPLSLLIFIVFLIAPVIDEIVGGWQFKRLCETNADIQVNKETAIGRTVYLAKVPDVEIKGTWVRVALQPRQFVDQTTGDIVVSYNSVIASGGLFKFISQGKAPLLFKGSCKTGDLYTVEKLFKELRITLIGHPS